MPTRKSTTSISLTRLVREINADHSRYEEAEYELFDLAVGLGRKLAQAKEMLKHGEWEDWVAENLRLSLRQCQKYKEIYELHEEVGDPEAPSEALLTLAAITRDLKERRNVRVMKEEAEVDESVPSAATSQMVYQAKDPILNVVTKVSHPDPPPAATTPTTGGSRQIVSQAGEQAILNVWNSYGHTLALEQVDRLMERIATDTGKDLVGWVPRPLKSARARGRQ
jgi:hypothetical protein